MNVAWRTDADGWITDPITASPDTADEYFVLTVEPDGDRYRWACHYHPNPTDPPDEDIASGTAPLLHYAQRNALAALLELFTGRRGRMVEHDQPLNVPGLAELQETMWALFTDGGKGGARTRDSINGWAKLAHRALVSLANDTA